MSMGAYDEDEHERREQMTTVQVNEDDDRQDYHGSLEFDAGESAEELLSQYEQIKGQ